MDDLAADFINKNIKIDNPATSRGATDWLQNKIDNAENNIKQNDPRTASGKGLVGATTASTNLHIPIHMLENLKVLMMKSALQVFVDLMNY